MASYAYDQEWKDERERLAGIERLWDPGSRALMERLGVGAGWRCLEVGAGGGSMVEWLSDRVGAVTAADVSTRFLDAIDRPNVEVRELDILADDLPEGEFDLVYARLVVEHLGRPALERMVPAGERVAALFHLEAVGRESDLPLEERPGVVFTLDGGKIVQIDAFPTQAEALEAVQR